MADQPEYRLSCVVADTLRLRGREGLHWFHVPNGESRSARTGARLKRIGTKAGEPDYVLIWKGRAIGLELKEKGGWQSAEQRAIEEEWRDAGGLYRCVKGYDEAMAFLELIQVLRPDHSLIRHQPAEARA